ncbi:hypothetical protein SRHO_G00228370 [Serrasalmus rhombeus]
MAETSVTQGGFGLEMGDYRDRLGINLHFSAPSPRSRQTSSLLFAYHIRNQIGEAVGELRPLFQARGPAPEPPLTSVVITQAGAALARQDRGEDTSNEQLLEKISSRAATPNKILSF